MPTATLSFNLPEEGNEHLTAINGRAYKSALWNLDQRLRTEAKHGPTIPPSEFTPALVRTWLWDELKDEGIVDLD